MTKLLTSGLEVRENARHFGEARCRANSGSVWVRDIDSVGDCGGLELAAVSNGESGKGSSGEVAT